MHPVYGKTGTAERPPLTEQAWYMCYVADPKRPIVIAVTVEQGGFGDQAAAPVARLMASEWFQPAAEARRRRERRQMITSPIERARVRVSPMSPLSPIEPSRHARASEAEQRQPRSGSRLMLDPLLTLAVIGLGDLLGRHARRRSPPNTIRGDPHYYVGAPGRSTCSSAR